MKRKASLDQIRKGLEILDVLECISGNPESMSPYFLFQETRLVPDDLISKLAFEEETPDVKKALLANAIKSYDRKLIEKFLMFVSGMRNFY